ncbi:hypothetical protein Emed_007251 [Eimeria media]
MVPLCSNIDSGSSSSEGAAAAAKEQQQQQREGYCRLSLLRQPTPSVSLLFRFFFSFVTCSALDWGVLVLVS